MSAGVFTPNYRFNFVSKLIGDCGDYSPFPLEIPGADMATKLDHLANVMYRVKYAGFDDNTLAGSGIYGGVVTGSLTPRVQSDATYLDYMLNGYWALDEATFPCVSALPYLGSQYSETVLIDGIGSTATYDFRDIADDERGMWFTVPAGESPPWNQIQESAGLVGYYAGVGTLGGLDEQYFKTAFTWFSCSRYGSITPPSLAIPYVYQDYLGDTIYEQLQVLVEFSGEVAFVGDMNDFFNSANKLFIGAKIRLDVVGTSLYLSSEALAGGFYSTAATYTLRLPSADLTCALGSTDASMTGNIRQKAMEWFPYAKGSPATAVWDTATGALL
jgi:hypothetical protein